MTHAEFEKEIRDSILAKQIARDERIKNDTSPYVAPVMTENDNLRAAALNGNGDY